MIRADCRFSARNHGKPASTSARPLKNRNAQAKTDRHKCGERLDQIAKGLGVPNKDPKLPVQKLFAQKAIVTNGVKRGTVYFAR